MTPGLGATEFLIILAMALVLFGAPTLLAFWLGYRAGSKRASETPPADKPAAELPAPASTSAPAPAPERGTDEEETQP